MIARHDWDVLLLGTSRVQMGLDPEHPAFRGMHAYNAGLPGLISPNSIGPPAWRSNAARSNG